GASVEIVAPEELARARAAVAGAQANLAAAQAQLDAARALGTKLPVDESPGVVQAAAQFKLAYRNLKRTTIVAPVDGTIGQRSVQVGQQVGPGVPLMSIVQLNQLWIEANFKEGQIRHMRVGQPVEVVSDLYGSRVTYRGRVQGFSAGTGSAFSMLPSQNAAGNWIKVVQRVPVVIALDARDLAAHPLRVGLSMRATVDTHDRNGHALDSEPPTPAVSTRVHDGVASDAESAAAAIIRDNQGG
ncbi:HlyD family efflux transporter periplasmic adaptor subunit, partial [Burkholderia sp. Se-20378]